MPKSPIRRGRFDQSVSRSRSTSRSSRSSSASSRNSHSTASSKSRTRSRSSSRTKSSRSRSLSKSSRSRSLSNSRSRSASASPSRTSLSSKSSRASRYSDRGKQKQQKQQKPRQGPAPVQTPPANKVFISKLSKNVTVDHLTEIFENYGVIAKINFPHDKWQPHLGRGYATIIFDKPEHAEKAIKYMDGGQIDGREVSLSKTINGLSGGVIGRRRRRRFRPNKTQWRRKRNN